MPELPEVETVRLGLERNIVGQVFQVPKLLHPRGLHPKTALPLDVLSGAKITSIHRRGKFLWIQSDEQLALIAHLGMSGQFRITQPETSSHKHLRALFPLSDFHLGFIDQRTFGWVSVGEVQPGQVPELVSHIALDPFDPNFDAQEVAHRIRASNREIKKILLDQAIISGIGNIYADESLWLAKINPEAVANTLGDKAVETLLSCARQVMALALVAGGTSFDELYVNVNGESGYFDRSLNVYGREGQPCPRCSGPISRIAFANRSTHYCFSCQK
ncbi:MAG: bifunctional DNA-formamidopyrimidine glycosylase/DNA-(apurinic or apyrimidinic site) lyase [Actinomycetes bacterium]